MEAEIIKGSVEWVSPEPDQLSSKLFDLLNRAQDKVWFGPNGMGEREIENIEADLELKLPPDFCVFLQNINDPNGLFFAWRDFSRARYQHAIGEVADGVAFDVEYNDVWIERWGVRPSSSKEAVRRFRQDFPCWPRLLPIFGHRFLPADPCLSGNPVFSIMQTDIVYYGANLADYLIKELAPHVSTGKRTQFRSIPIWSDFVLV
jgi:hypothetical protein